MRQRTGAGVYGFAAAALVLAALVPTQGEPVCSELCMNACLPAECDALKVPASKSRKTFPPGLPSSWEVKRDGGSLREPPELRLPRADPLAFLEQHRERLGAHTRAVRGLAPQVLSLLSYGAELMTAGCLC